MNGGIRIGKKLTKRYGMNQQARRAAKIERRGNFRMEASEAINTANHRAMTSLNAFVLLSKKQRRDRYIGVSFVAGMLGFILGMVMGWW